MKPDDRPARLPPKGEPLFVSAVPGKGLATRPGQAGVHIGAKVAMEVVERGGGAGGPASIGRARGRVVVDPDEVVEIPAIERARYSREYGRLLSDGALVVRTRADRAAWVRKQEAALREIARAEEERRPGARKTKGPDHGSEA